MWPYGNREGAKKQVTAKAQKKPKATKHPSTAELSGHNICQRIQTLRSLGGRVPTGMGL